MVKVKIKKKSESITEKVLYYSLTLYAAAISIMFLIAFTTAIYRLVKDPAQAEKANFGYAEGGYFE